MSGGTWTFHHCDIRSDMNHEQFHQTPVTVNYTTCSVNNSDEIGRFHRWGTPVTMRHTACSVNSDEIGRFHRWGTPVTMRHTACSVKGVYCHMTIYTRFTMLTLNLSRYLAAYSNQRSTQVPHTVPSLVTIYGWCFKKLLLKILVTSKIWHVAKKYKIWSLKLHYNTLQYNNWKVTFFSCM